MKKFTYSLITLLFLFTMGFAADPQPSWFGSSATALDALEDISKLDNYSKVTINFAGADSATWNTVATHEVFDVTGDIEFYLMVKCTGNLVGPSDSLGIQIGPNVMVKMLAENFDVGEYVGFVPTGFPTYAVVNPTIANVGVITPSPTVVLHGFSSGVDIGFAITNAIIDTGILEFTIWWRSIGTASVADGAGGAL